MRTHGRILAMTIWQFAIARVCAQRAEEIIAGKADKHAIGNFRFCFRWLMQFSDRWAVRASELAQMANIFEAAAKIGEFDAS